MVDGAAGGQRAAHQGNLTYGDLRHGRGHFGESAADGPAEVSGRFRANAGQGEVRREWPVLGREADGCQGGVDLALEAAQGIELTNDAHPQNAGASGSPEGAQTVEGENVGGNTLDGPGEGVLDRREAVFRGFAQELQGEVNALWPNPTERLEAVAAEVGLDPLQSLTDRLPQFDGDEEAQSAVVVRSRSHGESVRDSRRSAFRPSTSRRSSVRKMPERTSSIWRAWGTKG